jgi:DNA mismatch repair protein MutL
MPVRLLEDALIDQIAAGEVVERPASIVKELVENSLDAGATQVRVQLRGGGSHLVRIIDDGEGMDRDDALMCLERHATSKIRTLDDLVHVRTLGFRGEAIPSIASVSRFEILTRRHDAEVGTRLKVEGGALGSVTDAGCAPGTQISVKELFFNLPVRRAFLRTAPTELGHCVEAVIRQALLRPDVDMLVTHDGRDVVRAPAAADRAARARALLGKAAESLRPIEVEDRGVRLVGLASPVGVHQNSARAVYVYVNGRFVRDPVVRRGLREAYQGIVPRGRHPIVVLELQVADEHVDVNVHPSKTEVRFRNPRDVAEVIAGGLREALRRHGIRREVADQAFGSRTRRPDPAALPLPLDRLSAHPADDPRFAGQPSPSPSPEPELPPWLVADVRASIEARSRSQEAPEPRSAAPPQTQAPQAAPRPQPGQPPQPQAADGPPDEPVIPALGSLRRLAALDGGVVLLGHPTAVFAVDALAVRRALARQDLTADGRPARLLVPLIIEVGTTISGRLLAWQEALERCGLSLAGFGGGQIAIKRVPAELLDADWDRALAALGGRLPIQAAPALPDEAVSELVAQVRLVEGGVDAVLLRASDWPARSPYARRLDADELRAWIGRA